MQTQYKLDDGAIEAKLKVLNTLKDFIQIKHTLTGEVQKIAQDYEVDFHELWTWTTEQMFTENNIRPATVAFSEVKTPEVTKEVKVKTVSKPVLRKPKADTDSFRMASVEKKVEMVRKTGDPTLLAQAIKDPNRFVRTAAIKHALTPQRLIEIVVKQDPNVKIQRIAVQYTTNQTFLEDLVLKGGVDAEVMQKAVRRLKNKSVLQTVISTQSNPALVKAAAKTIYELTV